MKDRAVGPDRLRTNGSLTHERNEPSRRIEMRRVHRHPVPRAERATGAAERGHSPERRLQVHGAAIIRACYRERAHRCRPPELCNTPRHSCSPPRPATAPRAHPHPLHRPRNQVGGPLRASFTFLSRVTRIPRISRILCHAGGFPHARPAGTRSEGRRRITSP